MSRIILTLLFAALSAFLVSAQTNPASSQQSTSKDQSPNVSVPKPELAEASRLNASVVSLFNEGKYDEALTAAKHVLELREKVLEKDDEQVVLAVINVAEIQFARGDTLEARQFFERALKAYERALGPENVKLSGVLDRLALAYYGSGSPAETEKAYKRSLAIREKALGPEHTEVAQSVYHLAEFYQFQGEYKKAEPLYQHLISIREKQGSQPEALSEAMERYACLLHKTKREAEAEKLERQGRGIVHSPGERFIEGGVINGKALHLAAPSYPREARSARASGRVIVRVLIDESGKVIRACAIEGPNLLMKVSESAAYHSRFSPTKLAGTPVKVTGVIVYNFVAR